MYSFCITCTIFLLLGLSPKFAIANVDDVTNERADATSVFLNYLKVPWINLNSSWADEVSSACMNDLLIFFEGAAAGEMWALRMLDASSKIPAGLLTGNFYDLGMYDECVNVGTKGHKNPGNIQGRHCMISMAMPPKYVEDAVALLSIQNLSPYNPTATVDLSFTASVCFPSACVEKDIGGFVNASIRNIRKFEVRVVQVTCSSVDGEAEEFTLGTILAISFFTVVPIFQIFCTVYELVVRARSDKVSPALETISKFSPYTNASKLMSTKITPGTMPAINGFRFLSTCLIIIVHKMISAIIKPTVNLAALEELRSSKLAAFFLLLLYVVDTFFIISGFMMAYLFLKKLRSGVKLNIMELYSHRFIRLLPCMATLILFVIFFLPRLGSGPLWETALGVTSGFCRKNWWTNILSVQNFVNRHEMCMPHTWYLAAEMQLFWISPIVLFPLFYRPKLGLAMTCMFLIVALITPAILTLVLQHSVLLNNNKAFLAVTEEFFDFYPITYNRALPYVVGILLGYYVVNNKRKLTKAQVTFGWILSCGFILFCFWNSYHVQPRVHDYNVGWEASYVSVGRLGWSLAMVWILYACTHGYGGLLTKFLSLPIFAPLSRISYAIYLVSFVIQGIMNFTVYTADYHSGFTLAYLLCGDLVASVVFAFILTLFFETPVVVAEKIFRSKRSPAIIKCASMREEEKLLAIIRDHLGRPGGQPSFDSEMGTKITAPDFWIAVSEVLNTSGKGTPKTPAEWEKTWQNWKSNRLRNASQLKTCANSTQNASAHLQTGISTLENELLTFLAAVGCNSDEIANCNKSEVVEGVTGK